MLDVPCTVKRCAVASSKPLLVKANRRTRMDGKLNILFDKPEKAVSPGQVATIWSDNWCLGSGIIESTS